MSNPIKIETEASFISIKPLTSLIQSPNDEEDVVLSDISWDSDDKKETNNILIKLPDNNTNVIVNIFDKVVKKLEELKSFPLLSYDNKKRKRSHSQVIPRISLKWKISDIQKLKPESLLQE